MRDYGVSGLPVLDENHRFLGMFMKEELFDQLMRHFLAATEKGQES
jgi:CBS-domain-containing membrane protein